MFFALFPGLCSVLDSVPFHSKKHVFLEKSGDQRMR